MSSCVPSDILKTDKIYKWEGCNTFIETTGIRQKHCTPSNVTASDLCIKAAERWGIVYYETDKIVCPEIIIYTNEK